MPLPRLSALAPRQGSYTPVGSMNQQVTILKPSGRNGDGSTPPPGPFATTWAAIRPLAGNELYKAQQIAQQVSHLVTIPWQMGITQQMTISYEVAGNTRIFQIKAIEDPDQRQVELRFLVMEIENL